jgi:hypothetical protein
MRELIQIDSPAEHTCGQPTIQRWEVLEPIAGRWVWMTVFHCCDQVAIEAPAAEEDTRVRRAA